MEGIPGPWLAPAFTRLMAAGGIALAAVIGLLIGSFYTALADRILFYYYGPGRKSPHRVRELLMRPSLCRHCGRRLRAVELVPLVSFLLLRGRCASCGGRIGVHVLAGEVFTGLLLPFMLLAGFGWPVALFSTLACGHLYVSMATDLNFFLLDHENTAAVFLFASAATFAQAGTEPALLLPFVYSMAGTLAVFLLLFLVGRGRGMGFGDVLLAASVALLAGFPSVLFVFTLASAGAIMYVFVIRRNQAEPAPFGLFLGAATCAVLLGSALWRWARLPYWFPNT